MTVTSGIKLITYAKTKSVIEKQAFFFLVGANIMTLIVLQCILARALPELPGKVAKWYGFHLVIVAGAAIYKHFSLKDQSQLVEVVNDLQAVGGLPVPAHVANQVDQEWEDMEEIEEDDHYGSEDILSQDELNQHRVNEWDL